MAHDTDVSRSSPNPAPSSARDIVSVLESTGDAVVALLTSGDVPDWTAATPCTDMNLLQLVEHLVAALNQFAAAAEGEQVTGFEGRAVAASEAVVALRSALAGALVAWRVPGRLETEFLMPWGPTTGAMLVGYLVVEQVGHGWDVSRTLGRALELDDDVLSTASAVAHGMLTDEFRVPGMFGPAVEPPADCSPLDRLAAFLGRRP